jgi:hypothetical protein
VEELLRMKKLRRISRAQLRRILVLVPLVALGAGLTYWGTGSDPRQAALNLGSGIIGAVATYLLIDLLLGGTESRENRKRVLVHQMGSQVHDVAIEAAEDIMRLGYLRDGTLTRAMLMEAHLEGAFLYDARLQKANLMEAHLEKANFINANLEGAFLVGAYLDEANLGGANLKKAWLSMAHLKGTNLIGAHLEGAHLDKARFEASTTLPDGYEWTPETDMARFTDPSHSDFFQPPSPG